MHPYFNHLSSDLCQEILEFAQGCLLRKSGLHWLKIHLANLYAGGVDKLSYEGWVAFTQNHLEDIFQSTNRPLEGRRWWLSVENPFQCLAPCINLSEALRSSPPKTTISHMPVHQVLHSQHDHIQTEKCLLSEIKLIPPPPYSTQPHNQKKSQNQLLLELCSMHKHIICCLMYFV